MTLTIDRDRYGSLLAEYQPQLITTEAENERAIAVVEKLMAKIVAWKRSLAGFVGAVGRTIHIQ